MEIDSRLIIAGATAAVVVAGGVIACSMRSGGKTKGEFAGRVADVPQGTMKEVVVGAEHPGGDGSAPRGGRTILLSHTVTGKILATGTKCTHYNAPLVKGVLNGERIVCPWHGACFNACDGDIEDGPVLDAIPTFPVTVTDAGEIYVQVPPVVERGVAPKLAVRSASDARNFVIIGAGAAAATAIETLRANGYTGTLTVINKDDALPFDRTKLSKNMAVGLDDVLLRKGDFYERAGVTLKFGSPVTEVRTRSHEVVLANGDVIKYNKLLCATGGPARTFRAPENIVTPGADLGRIFPLREIAHSAGIEAAVDALGKDAPIVIVGSSFIGMEAAAYLAASKKCTNVTVIGMEKVPFERVLGLELGAFMQKLHEGKGVKFVMNAVVKEFTGADGLVSGVTLKSGATLPAALVILGAGIIPATSYLASAEGVELLTAAPGGVRVDEYMRAGEDVYAAGDIAYFPYAYGVDNAHAFVRIEHWDVAMDQGRVAALNMLGKSEKYASVPFFWTAQYGKSFRYAGYCKSTDGVIIHGSLAGADSAFTAYFTVGERVAAVASFNKDPQAAAAFELLRRGDMPTAKELRPLDYLDLSTYLRERSMHPGGAASAASASAAR